MAPVEIGPLLDPDGCDLNCSSVWKSSEYGHDYDTSSAQKNFGRGQAVFSMGKSDRVVFFTPEDLGNAYAVNGKKHFVERFGQYLFVVTDSGKPNDNNINSKEILNMYDFQNKFIAFNTTLREEKMGHVIYVVNAWEKLIVITSKHLVLELVEKDIDTKLNDLFKRNLYSTAISLAKSSGCTYSSILDMHRMYGDHLYLKGNFDEAVNQYCKTIGHVEPSYVIRKFLDAQRIQNLTLYMEALHNSPSVNLRRNGDHTTLLLNCYTKQMKHDKLKQFVENDDITKAIDVKAAINVLREAAYIDEALLLARKYREHDLYLKIQLEHIHQLGFPSENHGETGEENSSDGNSAVTDSLEYISMLPAALAERYLREYGKILMASLPKETTALLEKLCSNTWKKQVKRAASSMSASASRTQQVTRKTDTRSRNRSLDIQLNEDDEEFGMNGFPEDDYDYQEGKMTAFSASAQNSEREDTDTTHCNPENFIQIFVAHPNELLQFLRNMVSYDEDAASPLVWNTLLELTLREYSKAVALDGDTVENHQNQNGNNDKGEDIEKGSNTKTEGKGCDTTKAENFKHVKEIERQVMQILANPAAEYDEHHALVLVQAHGCKRAQLFLYEKLQMYHMLMQHYMETRDNLAIISKCKAYGANDPNLWVQVLMHFAQREENCDQEIRQVLHHIDRLNILPPLLVIQILSNNPKLPLSTVRSYIVGQLHRSQSLIDEDEKEIEQLRSETERMRNEIVALESQPKVFTSTKDNLTGAPLELPTVHFLSGNSYNLNTLPGGNISPTSRNMQPKFETLEDPKATSEQQNIADILQGLHRLNTEGVDEEFFHQLEMSSDGFETVSEYFGKCLFDQT